MPYGFSQTEWNAMPAGQKEGYVSAEAVKNKSQQTITPTVTPTIPATPQQTNLIPLRDTATQAGAQVGYDKSTGVTINNNPINTTGLVNYGDKAPTGYKPNTYYGTQEQIDELLSPYVYNNPNSAEAQTALENYNKWAQQPYVSPYAASIEGLVKNILSRTFQYDPANDTQFQLASKALTRNVMESMNSRGILNSTITENQVQQGVADLLPQYQNIAQQNFQNEGQMLMSQIDMLTGLDATSYNRYQDQGAQLANALDVVMKMDNNQYQKWSDAYARRYQAQQDEIKKAEAKAETNRQKVKDAWDRTSELGYVDNQSSIMLGVPAGTLSKEAREAKISREQELADQKTSLANQKAAALYQHNLSKTLSDYKNASTADPSTLGNAEQVQNYYALLDSYMGGGNGTYAEKPLDAYNWLIRHSKDNIALIGDKLYNKLTSELINTMKTQKSYGEKGLTGQQQFSQQNTVVSKALSMKNMVEKGGYNADSGEIVVDKPKYSNEEIAAYINNSGLDDNSLMNAYLQTFTEQELRSMGLWED